MVWGTFERGIEHREHGMGHIERGIEHMDHAMRAKTRHVQGGPKRCDEYY